jgi:DNA invertase Pin-like site-specific DNA recombinase
MRVALYARYSSDQQRDASIEDQLRVCRARADREGWTVVATFADHAISGATNQRPDFQRLSEALKAGQFDIVMAESLDRFSRDLEHIAAFYKQCLFNRARIFTLADGDVSELHIGLKGTMGALYLKDLSEKTRRGLEGRVRQGRCIGSPPYGYRVVRKLDAAGELDRGLREIDPPKAAIVCRVFEAYAKGVSPHQIAKRLNADSVAAPGGGLWYDATIRGRPLRGDGLLRNELYIGRMVWRRRANVKDPNTGRAVRRYNDPEMYVVHESPHLRIVDDALWLRVQARLVNEAATAGPAERATPLAFWDRRRPRFLLSNKVFCGVCGRNFKVFGKDYLRCRAAMHDSCRNNISVRRERLEGQVLEVMGRQLMRDDLLEEFIGAFVSEWDRSAAKLREGAVTRERERSTIQRRIGNLIEAIGDGRASPAILAKLAEFEAQLQQMCSEAVIPAHCPLPTAQSMADAYRRKLGDLKAALADGNDPESLEVARGMIDRVVIWPPETDGGPPGIELIGELSAMLQAGLGKENARGPAAGVDPALALAVSSAKDDTGAKPLALCRTRPLRASGAMPLSACPWRPEAPRLPRGKARPTPRPGPGISRCQDWRRRAPRVADCRP